MALGPGYGDTPVPKDELAFLLPEARGALGETITKAAIYDMEQAVQANVVAELLQSAFEPLEPHR